MSSAIVRSVVSINVSHV